MRDMNSATYAVRLRNGDDHLLTTINTTEGRDGVMDVMIELYPAWAVDKIEEV